MATRSGIYCRISSDREDLRLNVETQEADCRKLAASLGWQVVDAYVDNNVSAADPKKPRPQYKRMMADVASGRIDAIVTYKDDRLHRRPSELEAFFKACDEAGLTKMANVSGERDLADPDDRFFLRMMGNVAALEVEKTRQRIKRKKAAQAEAGTYSGGVRPFGYGVDPIDDSLDARREAAKHRNEINEVEAVLIREAANRVLEGATLYGIQHDWLDRGIKTATGKDKWSVTALKQMLIAPRVTGLRQHQGEIVGGAEWPGILDRKTWTQVREILTNPARKQPPPSRAYPLRGIIRCSVCESFMASMPRKGNRLYGCCKETGGCGHVWVTADHIERYVFSVLLPLADSPDLRNILQEEEASANEEAKRLVLAISEGERTLKELEDDYYQAKVIDKHTFLRQSGATKRHCEELQGQLAGLRGQSALDRLGGQVQHTWDELSADDKRTIIKSMVSTIEVSRATRHGSNLFDTDRIKIVFRFDTISKVKHLYRGKDGSYRFILTKEVLHNGSELEPPSSGHDAGKKIKSPNDGGGRRRRSV